MKNILIILFLFYSNIIYTQNDSLNTTELNSVEINGSRIKTGISKIYLDSIQTYNNDPNWVIWKTPSVTFQSDNGLGMGYTYIRMRGFDQTRINFNWNGIPMSDPIDMNCYFNNITNLNLYSKEVQVNRGVGISVYGGSSLAGYINIKPYVMVDSNLTKLNLSVGSYNTGGISNLNMIKLNDKWNLITGLTINKTDGYKWNSSYLGNSIYFSLNKIEKNNLLYFNFLYGNSRNGMSWLFVPEDTLKKDNRYNLNSKNEVDNFNQSIFQIGYNRNLSKLVDIKSFIYYNRLSGWFDVSLDNIYRYGIQSNMLGGNIHTNINLNNNKFTFGLSGYNVSRNYNERVLNINNYDNSIDKKEVDGFIIYELMWNKFKLINELSYRNINIIYNPYKLSYDSLFNIKYQFLTPKINLIWSNNNKIWNISFAYTEREPSRIDLLQGYENIDNNNKQDILPIKINSEKAISVELGNIWYNKFLKLNTNIFWIKLRDEIALLGKFTSIGYQMRINIPNSEKWGIESQQEIILFKWLKLNNMITYQKSKIVNFVDGSSGLLWKNQTHLLTPEWIWRSGLIINYKKINMGVEWFGNSWSYLSNVNDNNYKLPSWNQLNINIGFKYKIMNINLLLNNITNNKIYLSGMRVGNDKYYSQIANFNYLINFNFNF